MRKLFKKNQLIITALAALIAVAGYLNFADKNLGDKANKASSDGTATEENTTRGTEVAEQLTDAEGNVVEQVADTDDVEAADSAQEGTPGEAIFVNASGTVDFIVEAKLAKEYNRATAQEELQEVINNTALTGDEKQAAVDKMVEMVDISEREVAAENLIMAKGYTDVAVTMIDGYVDVIIVATELNMTERAQIEDIVKRKMQVEADKITINAIEVDEIK